MVATNALIRLEGDTLPADCTVVRYQAIEGVSKPFEVTVEFFSEDTGFKVDDVLRKPLLLTAVNEKEETRHWHGIVDRAEFIRYTHPRLYFRARLRPALSALAYREDSRIFQDKNIVDIATKLFDEAGFADKVEWQLGSTYDPKEFVVQYRESALNFVSRLFEDYGIFYFFQHKPDGHTMIVADDPQQAFVPMDDAPAVSFAMAQGLASIGEPLEEISRTRSLRPTNVYIRDYDFEKPQVKPDSQLSKPDKWALTYYEYPAAFLKAADGGLKSTARMRELRRDADVVRGASQSIGMRCGVPFSVDGAAEGCLNGEYVATSLVTRGAQNPESARDNYACKNEFGGIPKDAPFAPPRVARRPRVRGIQTAIVTGQSSDEQAIHVDKYGRIKVRFYWDRVGQQNETSSCWLRVAQAPMGGSMILPRIGWEVSVAFLEGDPDRPFCLGRVYNAEKTPPYALPGAKASGSVKSMSSPGGGGMNEIKMADSGGSQGFGVHAQKDYNSTVGHDKTEKVGVDETHSVKVNMGTSVGSNETIKVGSNQSIDVGANQSQKIGGSQSISVGANDTSNADSNYIEHVGGARKYSVGGNQITIQNGIEQTVSGNFARKVGAVQVQASVASITDNILGNYTENTGAVKVILAKGSVGETVAGSKNLTSLAAELHVLKGGYTATCDASVTTMIGGLHYQKLAGDLSVKGKMVTLLGAIGNFTGGGSNVKLGGGPIVMTGSAITLEAPIIIKMGASLKMGAD